MNRSKISFTINSTVAKSFNQQGCLNINTTVCWDSFEIVATTFVAAIDAMVKNKDIGADLHRWQLDFEGVGLSLTYEDTSASFWLELDSKEDQDTLDYIATLIEQSNE